MDSWRFVKERHRAGVHPTHWMEALASVALEQTFDVSPTVPAHGKFEGATWGKRTALSSLPWLSLATMDLMNLLE